MYNMRILFLFLVTAMVASCISKKIKNISYLQNDKKDAPTLNVFVPKKKTDSVNKVMIFVHGGNWHAGNKGMYSFIGRNFAKKGVVTVLPSYTLSPDADYDTMTSQIATCIKWVKENIDKYDGDSSSIFLSGHSAGGHLIALAALNPKYGIEKNTVSGIVSIDAAGLDLLNFLSKVPATDKNDYDATWTKDRETWKKASPVNFLSINSPPFLVYLGNKTYPAIKSSNIQFLKELNKFQPDVKPIMIDKKHVGMITQYLFSSSPRYDEVIEFMNKQ